MEEQEQRRKEVKENSVAITLSRQMPFSFYEKDKKKSKKKDQEERNEFIFKANKVPWICKVPLLEKINTIGEAKRQEKIAEESKRIMEMSKWPPRMQAWTEEQKAIK